MSDLVEITKHMQARDHLPDSAKFGDRERWDSVHLELADDVPGLVADVQRLYAENAQLVAELAAARPAIEYLIDANEGWVEITSCECEPCLECGERPKDCTSTPCSNGCSCRECPHCHSEGAIAAGHAALAAGRAPDPTP